MQQQVAQVPLPARRRASHVLRRDELERSEGVAHGALEQRDTAGQGRRRQGGRHGVADARSPGFSSGRLAGSPNVGNRAEVEERRHVGDTTGGEREDLQLERLPSLVAEKVDGIGRLPVRLGAQQAQLARSRRAVRVDEPGDRCRTLEPRGERGHLPDRVGGERVHDRRDVLRLQRLRVAVQQLRAGPDRWARRRPPPSALPRRAGPVHAAGCCSRRPPMCRASRPPPRPAAAARRAGPGRRAGAAGGAGAQRSAPAGRSPGS